MVVADNVLVCVLPFTISVVVVSLTCVSSVHNVVVNSVVLTITEVVKEDIPEDAGSLNDERVETGVFGWSISLDGVTTSNVPELVSKVGVVVVDASELSDSETVSVLNEEDATHVVVESSGNDTLKDSDDPPVALELVKVTADADPIVESSEVNPLGEVDVLAEVVTCGAIDDGVRMEICEKTLSDVSVAGGLLTVVPEDDVVASSDVAPEEKCSTSPPVIGMTGVIVKSGLVSVEDEKVLDKVESFLDGMMTGVPPLADEAGLGDGGFEGRGTDGEDTGADTEENNDTCDLGSPLEEVLVIESSVDLVLKVEEE